MGHSGDQFGGMIPIEPARRDGHDHYLIRHSISELPRAEINKAYLPGNFYDLMTRLPGAVRIDEVSDRKVSVDDELGTGMWAVGETNVYYSYVRMKSDGSVLGQVGQVEVRLDGPEPGRTRLKETLQDLITKEHGTWAFLAPPKAGGRGITSH
jgi:hypothetical protein